MFVRWLTAGLLLAVTTMPPHALTSDADVKPTADTAGPAKQQLQ
jgi:hypothetical protein